MPPQADGNPTGMGALAGALKLIAVIVVVLVGAMAVLMAMDLMAWETFTRVAVTVLTVAGILAAGGIAVGLLMRSG